MVSTHALRMTAIPFDKLVDRLKHYICKHSGDTPVIIDAPIGMVLRTGHEYRPPSKGCRAKGPRGLRPDRVRSAAAYA